LCNGVANANRFIRVANADEEGYLFEVYEKYTADLFTKEKKKKK
jgi:hypothetical protein